MATLNIELPPHAEQVDCNLRRWAELVADPELARFEGRIETDRHGHVLMSPPPRPNHGALQSEIAYHLRFLSREGRVITECPVSTADGVKAADVAWASPTRVAELADGVCFPRAPEICVEVLSPRNTDAEMREKKALYFDAGAREVWFCSDSGAMRFYVADAGDAVSASGLFPKFPGQIELR
jgi:Uma2 family endonuclease